MIRYARAEETHKVISIFNTCFPGEGEFAQWFFKNIYDYSTTLVYEYEGMLVATVQMLSVTLEGPERLYQAAYIYGVATLPEYRSRGIMDKVLNFSFEENKAHGVDFSILITQNDGLFEYYKKYGYEKYFYTDQATLAPSDNHLKIAPFEAKYVDQVDGVYQGATAKALRVVRSKKHYTNLLEIYPNSFVSLDSSGAVKAYAFTYLQGDTLVVAEIAGQGSGELAQHLGFVVGAKSVSITTAPCGGECRPQGMIKAISSPVPCGMGYINLLYN